MTVQTTDQYVVCRNDLNYRITAERIKTELGGEKAGIIMAFYQSAAPHGWVQLADSQYKVGSTVKTYKSIQSNPMFSSAGGNLQDIMKTRVVPIPAHSHTFTDRGHGHGGSAMAHSHGVNDPQHNHVTTSSGSSTDYASTNDANIALPNSSIYSDVETSVESNTSQNESLLSTRKTTGSSTTGITVNAVSKSGTSSAAKTGLSINDSADNSNNFNIKYCNVILCKKK